MGRRKKKRFCRLLDGDRVVHPLSSSGPARGVTFLEADEFEALRLCDMDEQDQSLAASSMSVSRATVQRLLRSGRRKLIAGLLGGHTIRIKGEYHMNICIPTSDDNGLESKVCEHFGIAPYFTIVNSESNETHCMENQRVEHGQGACTPLAGLGEHSVDVLIVSGMGRRAIERLHDEGIQAFLSNGPTVADAVKAWRNGELESLTSNAACSGHGR